MSQTSLYNKANINLVTTEVTTRIGIFLGLDFTTTKTLELNSNKYLSTIPSFSFSSDFTRVIIDYSNSQNNTDISLLNGLFAGLTAGITFTVSSAKYSIDGLGSEADLAGTYEFKSFVSNVIVAVPVNMTNFNQRLLRYESDYFVNPPQFGLSLAPSGQFTEYVIVNALGTDKTASFAKFGIYAGDKVKITGTQFNNSTFTVKSVTINKDGSETLVVKEGLTQESGFGNRVGIELIQEKKGSAIITAATGPTTVGGCGVYVNGVRVACYDNQTSDQCVARTSVTGGSPFYWVPNATCSQLPSTIVTTTVQTFNGNVVTTNALASLSSLGYFSSSNAIST
jgi:hypothetical protein